MKTPRNSREIAREVTNAIVSRLEAGTTPWTRSWSLTGEGGRPLRHEGTPYNGINCLWLWTIADARGYRSRYWMTARQAQELGAHVRRKADPSMSIYASSFRKAGQPGLMGEATGQLIRFLRHYIVYNADEIEGLPDYYYARDVPPTPSLLSQRQDAIDSFFAAIPARVRHGGDEAYYSPIGDYIQLPRPGSFRSGDAYASTRAHEVGNIASVLVAGGAGEGAVERYLRHLHCGEQSPGGGRLDARTAAGAATQRCGVIGIAAGASGIRRRLPASRSSAVLAR